MAAAANRARVLLVVNVEHGQANVFLATARELAAQGVEVHVAAAGGLEDSVAAVSEQLRRADPESLPIVYHRVRGLSGGESIAMQRTGTSTDIDHSIPSSFGEPLGFWNRTRALRDMLPIFLPYTGDQLVDVFSSIVDIIGSVSADLVVVDPLTLAVTACQHLGVRYVCLSPNTIKDFSAQGRPLAVQLRLPALFSGFAYPVPWYLMLLNLFYYFYTIFLLVTWSELRAAKKHLQAETGASLVTLPDLLVQKGHMKPRILVSTLPELDFPLPFPRNISPCGPIVRSAPPVSDLDPGLDRWLARGQTVYVNLGSLYCIAEDHVVELARALRVVLDSVKPLQVLWKLKKRGDYGIDEPGCAINAILGDDLRADRVRIVDWVRAEPISLLQTGHVVCSLHHGGANSFNEAVVAGVPQVVLPQWLDTYDFAERVEMLGIGRHGSRKTQPRWTATELSAKLLDVVGEGPASHDVRRKAKELAKLCEDRGSGAVNAARIILDEASANLFIQSSKAQ